MRIMKQRALLIWPWLWLWLFAATSESWSSDDTSFPTKLVSTTEAPNSIAEEFQFTQPHYNVSIPENSMGKTYVVPQDKMGIRMSPLEPVNDIKFHIKSGDKEKFFKAEKRMVGDFCFLMIRTQTGNVNVLNREKQDKYFLEIRATATRRDGKNKQIVFETDATVTVKVLDTNDLSPLFYPSEYEVTVTEDTPLHRNILRVIAEDADLGRNGEIYYSFIEETDQFAVHPVSGIITLTRPLKYVERAIHELTVMAEDRGVLYRNVGSRRASTARVTIRVQQVNLHAPDISVQHLPDLMERSNADIYAIVRVTDRDSGVHGEIASLDIVDGDPDGHFRIRPSTSDRGEYHIEVLRLLDRETAPQGYNLTLRAVDRGIPQRFSYKSVPVHLVDLNDNAPIFSREVYEVKIPETTPINTGVIRLKVTDADEGKNALVFLQIVGGNEGGEFYINPDTGMLYTAVNLDAEKKAFYTLTVSAVDQGNAGTRKQSSAKVKVYVMDTNDNDPLFDQSKMHVYVDENEPAGTSVVKVHAKDLDSGENAYISYSIENIMKVPFEIDHFSGIVKTKQVLDYETMKRNYTLQIRASDWGLPYRREAEMQLRIELRDVNDNRPQFERIDCVGHVPRYVPIGTEIITVSAIDFDAGNIISYRVVSGNEDNCFSLDSISGVLSVTCDLKDIKAPVRIINVTATDGTHFADVNSIAVHLVNAKRSSGLQQRVLADELGAFECHDTGIVKRLQDAIASAERNNEASSDDQSMMPSRYGVNEHTPEFVDFASNIKVNESMKVGSTLVKIKARDRDLGYNGKLVYGISGGDDDSVFGIDPDTGEIKVINYLDREKKDRYSLNVTVYDLGKPQKSNSKLLTITVLDANDNAPKFEKSLASFRVSENAINGTIIFRANATDVDVGENALVFYHLVTETEDFRVDRVTGILTVFGKLDRERQEIYELRIRAQDNGGKGTDTLALFADALVRITVDDVNDNPPTFALSNYNVKVREDVPLWSVVAILEATDPDEGASGEVDYYITDAMESEGFFKIDKMSGTVRVTRSLDFEERQVHSLTITAVDRGEPTLSSETTLIIEIVDVNENLHAPVFEDFVVSASVRENQPIGTIVTTVRAKDADPPGGDSRLGYSIRGGDGVGLFSIDDKGNIRTRAVLDVETKNGYWLTVFAQDHGVVPLSSKLQVYVEVLDVNDNTPLTELPVYYPSVLENSPAGVSVLQIRAFDRDVSPQQLTFSITSGNPEGYFLINSTTGLITTSTRKLDRENQAEHILEVTVRDDGKPSLSSTTRVVISVDDVNDHGPEFEQKFYVVQIPALTYDDKPLFQKTRNRSREYDLSIDTLLENGTWETFTPDTLSGDHFFRVLAHDKDSGENGKVQYSIKSGRGKGKFKIHPTTGMIYSQREFEAGQEFEMLIRASDHGDPQRSHQARVSVQVVESPKDSKNPPVIKTVNQNVDVTETDQVGFLVALIQATDKDGDTLWYDIVAGDERDEFYIGRDKGNVLLARQLDWERQNFYNLTISVSDGIHETKTNLFITVIDINDHRPEFTDTTYHVEISENVEKGEAILQLHATDKDEDKKLFYSLHNAQNQASLGIFHVDSVTGVITLNDALDRETTEEHILTVMVKDQGTPAKRNFARVIITVHDHNDHSPEFTSEIIQGKVFETSPAGTEVVQIFASDQDRGDNARITYSITSGNVGNVFTIDPDQGIIRIARELDLAVASEYILLVKASDHGSFPLTNTVPVHVMITMADNAPPRFTKREFAAEIYENQPVGTYVINVEARSTSSLQFEIVGGNTDDSFFVNPSTGVIITKNRVDYEKTKFFNLSICATNMAGSTAKTNVIVHILDKNDNVPKFLQAMYFGEISEGASIGSLILTNTSTPLVIRADDADSELNALLNYDIVEELPRKFFHIDSSTGAIRTVMVLDHEKVAEFTFHVKVSDLGKPKLSSETTAKVVIKVTDVNDCPPKFLKHDYNATVLLPTYKNVAVLRVEAVDADTTEKQSLKYDIIEGNQGHSFEIDSKSGLVTVRDPDHMGKKYLLHIRVSDGKYSTVAKAHINVEKSENSGLVFHKDVYEGSVVENSTKITTVLVVNVLGSELNEHIIFSILNPTDMFVIGQTSGAIRTTGIRFDREMKSKYELIVEARSYKSEKKSLKVAHVIVNITVIDINDNCPIFVNLPYYAVASVDAKKGDVITKVQAIDMDSGENGEVRYELKKGSGELFRVSRKTGEIILKQNLEGHNREQNREYQLTIAVYDGGITPCSVEVPVNVKVIDRSMPTFDKQFYTDSVLESIQVNSPLSLSIHAESPLNRKLIYSITKGNDFEEFALDFNTAPDSNNGPCVIYVVDELDYEQKTQYELTVRATDSVSGIYAEVLVSILVLDVNDCSPEFTQDSYNISVSEALPFGSSVLKVTALDNDTDINQRVRYYIQNDTYNSNDLFHIDPEDGTIYLKRSLDYEEFDSHHFTVLAVDRGVPSLSSTAHVWVTVVDMNDNPPKFEQPSYSCSLSQDAERGQFVTVVSASDPDFVDDKLTYTIVGGNEQQTYNIDQTTGVITLINMQNFGEQRLALLNVSVTDGVYTSFTRMKIEIIPSNKHSPKFLNPVIEVTVLENQYAGHLVTTVVATDDDFGDYGSVVYSIPSSSMEEIFDINRITGEITTKKSLDRERKRMYELLVMATDTGGKSGFLNVRVKVEDVNDNAPTFLLKEYKASINSNLTVKTPFLKVKASDADEGDGAKIEYSLPLEKQTSDAKDLFAIDKDTGTIYLSKSAQPYKNQLFQLFIRAEDKGTPQHHTDAPLDILIMSPEDTPPLFERKEDKFFISEASSVGTVVTRLKTVTNMTVKYRIVSYDEESQPFSIDQSGQIALSSPLDRESKDSYLIGVLAETDSSPPLTALAEISLHVLDENDHQPVFESNPYNIEVAENVNEGSSILRVIAHDEDLGSNGEVRYSFGSDIGELANVFTVDTYTGWISTLVPLDKEKQPEYKFQVIAIDNGNLKHFARTTVNLKLKDYNDHAPAFRNDKYETTVNEDAIPGTVIETLSTVDKDEIVNSCAFYITSGDPRSQFQIRPTGEIYVAKPLDRESIDRYELTIVGTDGLFVFETTVVIQVMDVNDNPPYCLRYRYKEVLSEGSHPGTYVLTVLATDYDDEPNAKLRFYLTGTNSEKFALDKESGVLKVVGPLDREAQAKFVLRAHVQDRDKPTWECSSLLEISISDLNDNPPRFTMQQYSATLLEDVKIGTLVTKVHATDDDIGINRKIRYEFIDNANDQFNIAADSGIITLTKPLDRETKAMYNVSIQATDQGVPQLSSVTSLIVNVQDINDNPPEFSTKLYYAQVPEVNPVGTEIARVLATSKDTGVNAEIYYSIVGGNEHKKFQIDTKSGIISIAEQLDYERAKDYYLTIQAVDGGVPPLSNHATVNVTVTDSNDNQPVFTEGSYKASIREDSSIGSYVVTISANDLDSGENGIISYSIERGDRLKQFAIDQKTGEITVAAPLDRETIQNYVLEVHARDNGIPTMSNFVLVNVEVIDSNDNPPLFSQTNYTTVVQEDKQIGHAILQFTVTDADVSPNADPYTFDFRSGNEGNYFRLEQDGTLRTATKFNNRVKDRYTLHIRVFDNGSPPLYSDAWVVVKVIEESQYPPVITPLEVTINSFKDEFPGGIIGRVHASDKDQYDTLLYDLVPSLPNTNLFEINRLDGTLVALPRLDVGEYYVNVSVTDSKFISYSTVKVNVDLIPEKMLDNSVIVRFRDVSPENFLTSHRKGFIRTVRHALNSKLKDVVIISIQPSMEELNTVRSRAIRQTVHNDLDLLFAVKVSPMNLIDPFFSSEVVREALNQRVEVLEESTKLVVEEIVRLKCTKMYCANGECQDKIVLDVKETTPILTDLMSFVSPKHRHTMECHCKQGYAGDRCEMMVNKCAYEPCHKNEICVPDYTSQGYSCRCKQGYSGPKCKIDANKCTDSTCYNPQSAISFSGKSYVKYKINKSVIKDTMESKLSFSLKLRTMQLSGNIMYAAGKIDYNILEIENGIVQYRFDLGSGEGVVSVSSRFISDGQWHEIELERTNNIANLKVDKIHVAQNVSMGSYDILNLESDDLYLGAEVRQMSTIKGTEIPQRGFVGCMADIVLAKSVLLPNGNNAVTLKGFYKVDFSCDNGLVPLGPCGSQPCHNGGTCKESSDGSFECNCLDRFSGSTCEIDSDPCASSPCLFGGKCHEVPMGNDFYCECASSLTGNRCQFGMYCKANTCRNSGECEEGNNGPICKCKKGFSGDWCESDINECENSPCENGGTCINEEGSYQCVCTYAMSGTNCTISFPNTLIPIPNLTMEQLMWIGIAVLANIFFIIIFVMIRKCRKRRMRNRIHKKKEKRKKIVSNSNSTRLDDHDFKRISKLSNVEVIQREPPQCPPRPASYTPSSNTDPTAYSNAAAVTLNNLDTLRSYGSAGDELENFPPDYLRNLNRSTPVPPPSLALTNTVVGNTTGSDADSLHKPTWQEQMQLASFITDQTTKIKNDLKRASPVVPELSTGGLLLNSNRRTPHGGGISITSLSSNEDDPRLVGGYHWDCSDWVRPSQNPLPNITEVPGSEVPDSSSFHSNESNESNTHQIPLLHNSVDPTRDIETLNEDQESEYVGDSECNTEFSEHYRCSEMQRLNPLDSGGEGEYKYKDSESYLRHPNSYLPHYNIHTDIESEANPLNGRLSTLESDEEEDVVPYGFPSTRRNRCHKGDDVDEIGSVITTLEERNSLLGGANSNSDLSTNLCEIDDSEFETPDQKSNGRIWISGNGITQTSV